jgi:hypothetical protein
MDDFMERDGVAYSGTENNYPSKYPLPSILMRLMVCVNEVACLNSIFY